MGTSGRRRFVVGGRRLKEAVAMQSQDRRRILTYIGIVVVVGTVLVWGTANRTGRAGAADEPTVIVVDEERGKRQEMSIEEYVAAVVAGEMKRGWPQDAYAAQAILARTFALRWLEEKGTREIPASHEQAQAYAPENITRVIRRAVRRTRGKVATYDGEPIQAWFHAYSGGETASAKEGLAYEGDEPPYIKRVKIPRNTVVDDELKRWRVRFSPAEVRRALGEADVDVGAIEDITVAEKGPTGRITQVRIKGSGGETTMTGPAFRLALGAFEMKSTKVDEFDWDRDSGLTVSGTGFGHGVGLSQWDALMFAKEGQSPEDIVKFFYDGVHIEKRW